MADQKLTQRPIGTEAASNDLIHFVDVSDTTDAPEGTSKQITKGNFASDITPTANEILTAIKTVDGAGSGLDADRLDGQHGTYYYRASNPNGYTDDQTPAEILTAIKTVDGIGSGLDADTLRTYVPTTSNTGNTIVLRDAAGNFSAENITADNAMIAYSSNAFRAVGSGTGTSNISFSSFFESNASTRQGYVGFPTSNNSDLFLKNDVGNNNLRLQQSGNFLFEGGTVTAPNFILSSDKRLKENIKPYLADTINIDLKTFKWKQDKNKGRKQIGVIAQELEIQHPEFVITNEEGFKSVAYIDLLLAKNAELEDRVKRLENKLDKLIASIA